jgi:hypothetical protein
MQNEQGQVVGNMRLGTATMQRGENRWKVAPHDAMRSGRVKALAALIHDGAKIAAESIVQVIDLNPQSGCNRAT